jgi:hypothetical protein
MEMQQTHCDATVPVTLLWKCYKDLTCHNIYIYIYIYIYMGVFIINKWPIQFLQCLLFRNLPWTTWLAAPDHQWSVDHSLRNTDPVSWLTMHGAIPPPSYVYGVALLHQGQFDILSCSCRWGDIMSLNCGHQRTFFSSLRWYEYGEPLRKKNEELGEKPVSVPLFSSQIPRELTRASAMRLRRLTALGHARPTFYLILYRMHCYSS